MVAKTLLEQMQKKPAPCYLLSGDEEFLKDAFIREVKALLPAELADFNFDVFRGGADSADTVVSAVRAYPVLSDFRVVAVKDCSQLKEDEQQKILACVESPPGHTLLLLDVGGIPGNRAFLKKLSARGKEVRLGLKGRDEAAAWIRAAAAKAGKKISRETVEALREGCGGNLRLLSNELDRLVLQAGERDEITLEDVACGPPRKTAGTGFELGGAISRGDCGPALRILSAMAKDAVAPEMILGSLAWHFRAVWKVHAAITAGTPAARIPSVCGIPPFRAREFSGYGRRTSDEALGRIFDLLLETDISLKTRQTSTTDLEVLVVKLCGLSAS